MVSARVQFEMYAIYMRVYIVYWSRVLHFTHLYITIYKAQAMRTYIYIYIYKMLTTTLQIRWLTSFAHMSTRPPLPFNI